MENIYSLNIATIFKTKPENIFILDNFLKTKKILESRLMPIFKKFRIKAVMLKGKPFFITGKTIAEKEDFTPGNSPFYSSFNVLEYINQKTYEEHKSEYACIVKKEHLPDTNYETVNSKYEEYVSYQFSFLVEENLIQKDFDSLLIKEEVNNEIKNVLQEILSIKINNFFSFLIYNNHVLATELFFKSIQYSKISSMNSNNIIRFQSEQKLKINNGNKSTSNTLNTGYVRGNQIFFPCHTQEDFSYNIIHLEKEVFNNNFFSRENGFNEYINLWNINYHDVLLAKKTIDELGYSTFFVRSNFKYTLNEDISEINNTPLYIPSKENIREKELEINNSIGYYIIKYQTGEWERKILENNTNCMVFTKNKSDFFVESEIVDTKVLSIHASLINNDDKVTSVLNFYGDINNENEKNIMEYLNDICEEISIPLIETNLINSLNYENEYNIMFSTKEKVKSE